MTITPPAFRDTHDNGSRRPPTPHPAMTFDRDVVRRLSEVTVEAKRFARDA
jgi:hypothetical protein